MAENRFAELFGGARIARGVGGVVLGALASLCGQSVYAVDESSLPAIPDYYQEAGVSRNKGYENQSPNELIDTFSGKLQYHFTDLFIPGNGGFDLAVQRSYNAIDDPDSTGAGWPQEISPFGLGWNVHFGRVIRGANQGICSGSWSDSSRNPVLEMPDGQRRVLYEYGESQMTNRVWISKDFWRATCILNAGDVPQGLNVESPDGTRYEMTAQSQTFGAVGHKLTAYYTTRIVDRNGNMFDLNYAPQVANTWAISSISNSVDGRSLTFSYNATGLLTSITDGARVWNYEVVPGDGGHYYLSKVTRPDGLFWEFSYNAESPGKASLKRVIYPGGGTIDYTYGDVNFRLGALNAKPSTVVKTKVSTPEGGSTDPSGTWKYSYVPATSALPYLSNGDGTLTFFYAVPPEGTAPNGGTLSPDQLDTTTVEGPEIGRLVKHYHLGAHSVNVAGAGGRGIGRYAGYVSPEEAVSYGYHEIRISAQNDVTGSLHGLSDKGVYAAFVSGEGRYRGRSPVENAYSEVYSIEKSSYDKWGNPAVVEETGFGGLTNLGEQTRRRDLTYEIPLAVDANNWRIRQVREEVVTVNGQSHTTSREFDPANGNVLKETLAGVSTRFTYYPTGDVATRVNALDQVTTYSNYKRGIAQIEAQPGSVTIYRVVDNAGNVTEETNGRGFKTSYSYDGLNRVTGVTPPIGNAVSVAYSALSRSVSRGGMQHLQRFDGLGRLTRQEASATGETSIAVDYRYDARGRKVFQSNPNSSLGMTYVYDDLDRVIETSYPLLDGQSYREYRSYTGMRTLIRDDTDRYTALFYRAFGSPGEPQLMAVKQGHSPNESTFAPYYKVSMERNVLGQVTSVVKGKNSDGTGGWTRSYGYNSNFYLVSQSDPEVGTTLYSRDLLGNLTGKKVGSQPVIGYGLDSRNRVSSITYSASENALVPQAPNVTYTYLGTDAVDSVTSGGVVRRYIYDEADRITTETLEVDPLHIYSIGYGYNDNGALSSITYPSGSVVSFSPDGYGRPGAAAPYVTDVDYHPNGMPMLITYANGISTSMALNDRLWPASLGINRVGGDIVQNVYAYDLVGNLTSITDSLDDAFNRSYEYDYVNRLVMESGSAGVLQYVYDNVGNVLGVNIRSMAYGAPLFVGYKNYEYDASSTGRLIGFSSLIARRQYSYDLSGNVVGDGAGMIYGYDRANNLRYSNYGGASQVLHDYDGNNIRVKSLKDGAAVYSIYDHRGLLLQTEAPGVERKEYVYLGRRQVAERKVPLN